MNSDSDPIDLIPFANPVPELSRLPEGPEFLVDAIVATAEPQLGRRLGRLPVVAAAVAVVMMVGVVAWAWLRSGAPYDPDPAASQVPPSTVSVPPSNLEPRPSGTLPFVNGELVRLDLPRANIAVSDADVAAVVRGDIALGLDLLRVSAGDENVMVSPYSVASALSMLYPGARGKTATEIAATMHLAVDDATLHAVRSHIDQSLASTSQGRGRRLCPAPTCQQEDAPVPFTIRPINSAWGQGGYPFLDDYLSILASEYDAGLRLVDFISNPEAATDLINDWVMQATEDRIPNLIPADAIDSHTRLVLVNAVWFAANWVNQFDPAETTPGSFRLLDDGAVTVPMMHAEIRTGYTTTDRFEALRLPYEGDAAMVIALPTEGSPAELVAELHPADFDIRWGDHLVEVTLPQFAFDAEVALKDALQQLGIRAAFVPPAPGSEDTADLTGVTPIRELYVKEAFHNTSITVDEHGTEAAAATSLVMTLRSVASTSFTADRPFLFWIEHTSTGEVLFLGQVTNPAG